VGWNKIYIYIYTYIYFHVYKVGNSVTKIIHIVVYWVVTLCSVVGGYISEILIVSYFCLRYV